LIIKAFKGLIKTQSSRPGSIFEAFFLILLLPARYYENFIVLLSTVVAFKLFWHGFAAFRTAAATGQLRINSWKGALIQ
jgi:hypothetical protein